MMLSLHDKLEALGECRPPPSGAVAGECAKLLLSETLTTERESLKGGGGG